VASTYGFPIAAQPAIISTAGVPQPTPAQTAVVPDSGTRLANQVGSTANILQSFPDPSTLTNLDALLDLSEHAADMVRRMVPANINQKEG
jgi:hypothetical protein